jgi:prepilin-type processing-associated H-X9-DG protein
MSFTKKDLIVSFGCIVFILVTLGNVGSTGRRRAKEALCLSNLGPWGQIWLAYAEDNDGYFMRGWWFGGGTPGPFHTDYWMEALRSYYVNPDLRCCPEASIPGTELGSNQYGGAGPFTAWGIFSGECGKPSNVWSIVTACDYGSYGANAYVCNPPLTGPWDVYNWRTPDVDGAENIPMFGDHQWLDCWPNYLDSPPEYDGQPWNQGSQMGRICMNRHSGFVNWAFLDGSARKVGIKELWTLKWHRMYVTDGPWTIGGGVIPEDWPDWMQDFEDY